jgi:hypothetical protein
VRRAYTPAMEAGERAPRWVSSPGRRVLAGCAGAVVFMLALSASASAASLTPDLRTRPLTAIRMCKESLTIQERSEACHGTGRTVLRLTNRVANYGRGPIEFTAVAPAADLPEDCHGNGDVDVNGDGIPDDDDTWVEQRTYNDVNSDGVFQRSIDTTYTTTIVGCRYYHPEHRHYHLDGFARFQLYSESNGQLVRSGNKISFCVADSNSFDVSLPGAPQSKYYAAHACNKKTAVNGTSVGWFDQYGWALPGQEIDITGIPAGTYCIVAKADPDNQFLESDDTNNDAQVRVKLDPAKAPVGSYLNVQRLSGACTFGA